MNQRPGTGMRPLAGRTYETSYRVRFDECGPDGLLPASGYLRFAQDLAWLHSAAEGFDRTWYAARGLNWLIRAVELDLLDSLAYGEELHVTTEVLGFRRAWARRRSHFSHAGDQRPLAVAAIDWLLLNGSRPVRVPAELSKRFGLDEQGTFTPLRVQAGEPSPDAYVVEFAVRRNELDPWAHVNNATYLDYIDELLASAGQHHEPARLPRRYRVEYISPAKQGINLQGAVWAADGGWSCRLTGPDEQVLMRATLESDPSEWVGG